MLWALQLASNFYKLWTQNEIIVYGSLPTKYYAYLSKTKFINFLIRWKRKLRISPSFLQMIVITRWKSIVLLENPVLYCILVGAFHDWWDIRDSRMARLQFVVHSLKTMRGEALMEPKISCLKISFCRSSSFDLKIILLFFQAWELEASRGKTPCFQNFLTILLLSNQMMISDNQKIRSRSKTICFDQEI